MKELMAGVYFIPSQPYLVFHKTGRALMPVRKRMQHRTAKMEWSKKRRRILRVVYIGGHRGIRMLYWHDRCLRNYYGEGAAS